MFFFRLGVGCSKLDEVMLMLKVRSGTKISIAGTVTAVTQWWNLKLVINESSDRIFDRMHLKITVWEKIWLRSYWIKLRKSINSDVIQCANVWRYASYIERILRFFCSTAFVKWEKTWIYSMLLDWMYLVLET